ncbi:MAG: GYD domain-containing protein [Candidatus Thorarchaeota archaeon]
MPVFVIMGSLTEKGVKNIKDAPKRQKQAEDIIKSVGGKLLGLYYTFGKYDWVSIVEGPSIEAAMKALLTFGKAGTNRTRTMVAVTAAEANKIIGELPD